MKASPISSEALSDRFPPERGRALAGTRDFGLALFLAPLERPLVPPLLVAALAMAEFS
jgi:hypothetical protein